MDARKRGNAATATNGRSVGSRDEGSVGATRKSWTPGKRAAVYVAVTFALTWAVEFGVIGPMAANSTGPLAGYGMSGMSIAVYALIAGMMLMPSVGMLLTRLITREGMRDAWIKPARFGRTWKWWLLAWLGPIALTAAGAAVYFAVFPGDFDPSMGAVVSQTVQAYEAQGLSVPEDQVRAAMYGQMAVLFVAPLLNLVPALGEEWG